MKTARLLLRGIVAALLGLALTLSAATVPARADGDDGNASYWEFIDILINAFEKGRDGRYSPADVSELIQQVIGAVDGAKVDLLARLDTQLTNEIRGKTEAALTKVELLRVPWAAGPALNSTHDAAYAAKAHLNTIKHSDTALDAVGKAMVVLFTELNTAYIMVDAGEGTALAATQRPYFREGLEYLIQEMDAACVHGGVPNAGLLTYTCSYGGRTVRAEFWAGSGTYTIDGGPPIAGPINTTLVVDALMTGTARPLAQRALDVLVREGVQLPQRP